MEFSNVEKELLRNLGKQNGETRKTSDSGNTDAGIGKKRKNGNGFGDIAGMENLKKMVIESGFKYDRQSEGALKKLKEIAEFEGYLEDAKSEFEALEKKLQHNLDAELDRFAEEIKPFVASEIVKRYYFQRGVIIQQLKKDPDLDKALEVLGDSASYAAVFAVQK